MASAARLKLPVWLSATKKRNCRIESGMRPAGSGGEAESSGPDRGKAGSGRVGERIGKERLSVADVLFINPIYEMININSFP